MGSLLTIFLSGIIAILIFDTVGALAARRFQFNYVRLTVGSLLIYLSLGVLVGPHGTVIQAGMLTGGVGLVEATAGWAISWRLGPGRPEGAAAEPSAVLRSIVSVVLMASVFGATAAYVGSLVLGSRTP